MRRSVCSTPHTHFTTFFLTLVGRFPFAKSLSLPDDSDSASDSTSDASSILVTDNDVGNDDAISRIDVFGRCNGV